MLAMLLWKPFRYGKSKILHHGVIAAMPQQLYDRAKTIGGLRELSVGLR